MKLKKLLSGFVLSTALMTSVVSSADAQVYVRVRPPRPKIVVVTARPVAPSPRHVWVDEDWAYRNGNYAYTGGYWSAPPRGRAHWVPGHWIHGRRGDAWIGGHWR